MTGQRFDYSSERQRHEKLVGRAALLARLDQLLVDGDGDRWVVITGGPGMGKSAILAAWLARRDTAGTTVPHHFIRRGQYDWDDPAQLVASLVAQLEDRFTALPEPEADARMHPASRLARMLSRVSEHELVPHGKRLVVLIDGLDEYDPPAKTPPGDPLTAFLPHALPAGVSMLCASRPRHPYVASLAARDGEFVAIDLDDPVHAPDNEATVRAFWERAAGPLGLELRDRDDARFVDEAVARACGNVQHAVQLRKQLAALGPELRRTARRRIDDIPRGLQALIAQSWERIAVDPIVVHGLGILCVAREALSLDELGAVGDWAGDAQRPAFVRGAMELLVEIQRPDSTREYRLHHDAIRAHIACEIGSAALSEHHRSVARRLACWPCPPHASSRRYALRHAVIHRAEAGDRADAWRLAADTGFLEARCRELGVHETEADVTRLAARCRASGDEVLGQRSDDLARALARESHLLRVTPEVTSALVWNRLRRSGWSAEEIDRQLRVPERADFLRVRQVQTPESPALIRNLEGHTDGVTACAVTPDGRYVVSASLDQTLKIWELVTGRALNMLEGHTGRVSACAVTPDGRHVVSASADKTLKVWDLASGHALATLEGHTDEVWACAVTPDGQHVVSASWDKTLKVWDLASGHALATFKGHTHRVIACAVTPDGRHVVSASADKTLKVWELATGRALTTLEGHTNVVWACAVTPDGQHVVSASWDKTLKVWELATGRALATLKGHTESVSACTVTPDGRHVVSASWDWTLKVWELATGRALATLKGHTGGVAGCAVTPDGRHVISASWDEDQTLKVWELATERALATLAGHAWGVTVCAVTSDGRHMVSASSDQTLKVWELATGRALATLEGHTDVVTVCAVTPDGRHAISASRDETLKVWELATGRALATLEGHTSWVSACAMTPDGRHVVSASHDQTLKVWELATGRALATLKGHTDLVTACAVTPDGRHVVSASDDKTLKVWELATGRALATLEGHTSWVSACAVTPDGRHVVSASGDKTLKVWDLATGHALTTLEGHTSWVSACAVTPDGRHVVSVSGDKTLKVWELASGRAPATLTGHTGKVTAYVVTPDGRHVVSASEDQTLKVWELDTYLCRFTHRGDVSYCAVAATTTVIVSGDEIGGVWFLDIPLPHRSDAGSNRHAARREERTMPFTLTTDQERDFREAIIDAFSPGDLAIMVQDHIRQPLHNLVAPGPHRQQVFELVMACRQRGWLGRLAFGAIAERSENLKVIDFAREVGLHPAGAPGHVEKLIGPNTVFVDPHSWLPRCTMLASRVCQVRVRGKKEGTGFLIGPDAVLTNHHVVAGVLESPGDLTFVFDYARGASGEVHPGISFAGAKLLAASPQGADGQWDDPISVFPGDNELDFALVQLVEPAGTRGLGGTGGRQRGWIEVAPEPFDFTGNAGLAILQHPKGDPVKLALDFADRGTPITAARRVRYTVPTEPGSSGSPVFSATSLTLVALHHGGVDHAFNQGIPVSAIAAHPAVKAYLVTVPVP